MYQLNGIQIYIKKLHGLSPRANYTTERPPLVDEVSSNFLLIEGATWSSWRIHTAVFSVFWTGAATFCFKYLLSYTHEAERTSFQTRHFSENLVAPGNRTRTSASVLLLKLFNFGANEKWRIYLRLQAQRSLLFPETTQCFRCTFQWLLVLSRLDWGTSL
jgi:hypothetical protein